MNLYVSCVMTMCVVICVVCYDYVVFHGCGM